MHSKQTHVDFGIDVKTKKVVMYMAGSQKPTLWPGTGAKSYLLASGSVALHNLGPIKYYNIPYNY